MALTAPLRERSVEPLGVERLDAMLTARELRPVHDTLDRAATALAGRTVWCVNSTALGGGVAQMLETTVGFAHGAGVDARWVVIGGDERFFRLTKRLHHMLHGRPGDGGPLGPAQRALYDLVEQENASALAAAVAPGDVVVLHDPQTAGLAPAMREAGATVIWRAHIGTDRPNALTARAQAFLAPDLEELDAYVFSIPAFAWRQLPPGRVTCIAPAIDATAPKNAPMTDARIDAELAALDLHAHGPMLLHLARWDRLKDPLGMLAAFVQEVAPASDADLVLAGAAPGVAADDPEAAEVLRDVQAACASLPAALRRRVRVRVMAQDATGNALLVNALQRRAAVVLKKSVAEGFGLGLTEAMWKSRPVVAAAAGGVPAQVVDGRTGLLAGAPDDRAAFGGAVLRMLSDPELARAVGAGARRRVRRRFLEPRHLVAWLRLLSSLQRRPAAARRGGPRPASRPPGAPAARRTPSSPRRASS